MENDENHDQIMNKLNSTIDRLANTIANAVWERAQANLNEKMAETKPGQNPKLYVVGDADNLMSALHDLADRKNMEAYEVPNDQDVDTAVLIDFYMKKDEDKLKH